MITNQFINGTCFEFRSSHISQNLVLFNPFFMIEISNISLSFVILFYCIQTLFLQGPSSIEILFARRKLLVVTTVSSPPVVLKKKEFKNLERLPLSFSRQLYRTNLSGHSYEQDFNRRVTRFYVFTVNQQELRCNCSVK